MSDFSDAGPLLPECEFAADIPRDAQGCLPVGALAAASGCRIAEGDCFTLYNLTKQKEEPMAKTPKHSPPPPAPVEPVEATGEEAAEEAHTQKEAKPLAGPPAAPAAHVAAPDVPVSAVAEVQALLPKDGGAATGVTVLLTLIAVGGGGAAWKFYQSFAKQKHEQRMKELELKEKKLELQDDRGDHKLCEAARAADRAALEAKIEALEARLVEAEKPAQSLPELPFDPEDLQERLAELEKALKKDISKKPKKKD